MALPLVSIVIATRNRPAGLFRLLACIREQDYPNLEIIVVDDGSHPALLPLPVDRQIRHDINMGVCTARNDGFGVAKGKYVVIFDDDALPASSNLISRAVVLAESTASLGAIGFRQLTPEGKVHYMQPSPSSELCYAGHFFGYGTLFRRKALTETSGFSQILDCHEEVELSLRLLDAGYVVLFDPSLEVIHYEEPEGRDWGRILKLYLRNVWFTIILRYPLVSIGPAILVHLFRHVRRRRARRFGLDFREIVWASGELIFSLPTLCKARKAVAFKTLRLARQLGRKPVAVQPKSEHKIKTLHVGTTAIDVKL